MIDKRHRATINGVNICSRQSDEFFHDARAVFPIRSIPIDQWIYKFEWNVLRTSYERWINLIDSIRINHDDSPVLTSFFFPNFDRFLPKQLFVLLDI